MSQGSAGDVLLDLRPFAHQVGGHTCVLEVNNQAICKPLCEKEVWFYHSKPQELEEFTPKYLGNIDVLCNVEKSPKNLKASVPRTLAQLAGLLQECKASDHSDSNRKRSFPGNNDVGLAVKSRRSQSELELWSVQCIDRQIQRKGFWANNRPQKFILLENLVRDYHCPCLMDMKMGTRQYGEDSTQEKRKLLAERCANSTSSTLGFRICGTQVFQVQSQTYIKQDKYVGRDLDAEGAAREIKFFFGNGLCLRKDVIQVTIRKLERLREVLKSQEIFFFYSCSLLLMYDGLWSPNALRSNTALCSREDNSHCAGSEEASDVNPFNSRADVRLIDFAHVSTKDRMEINRNVDGGILFGLDCLISILQSF